MMSKLRSIRLNRGIFFLLIPGIVLGLISLVISLGGNGVVADGGFPTSRSVLKGVQQALNAPPRCGYNELIFQESPPGHSVWLYGARG